MNPNLNIIHCEQGSEKWHELRKGRITASKAQAIAANGKGLDTLINEVMQKYYSHGIEDGYKSKAMQRGNELEDSARFAYEVETGNIVDQVGFVIQDDYSGCSPDGLINDDGAIEIKCLEDKAYFQYLMTEKIDTGYEWQCHMIMLICCLQWIDYVAYNPNFKQSLIIKRIFRNPEKDKAIEKGLLAGTEKIKAIKLKMDTILK